MTLTIRITKAMLEALLEQGRGKCTWHGEWLSALGPTAAPIMTGHIKKIGQVIEKAGGSKTCKGVPRYVRPTCHAQIFSCKKGVMTMVSPGT